MKNVSRVQSTELDIVNGSFCNLCALAVGLALHFSLGYTVLTSSNKSETAVHCCDPALSVLVMLVSRNVFHAVSALQSIVFILMGSTLKALQKIGVTSDFYQIWTVG